jgi:hypothetical protein
MVAAVVQAIFPGLPFNLDRQSASKFNTWALRVIACMMSEAWEDPREFDGLGCFSLSTPVVFSGLMAT